MTTPEEMRAATVALTDRAKADLAAFVAQLDLTDPEAARDALLTYVALLVERYGEVAAGVAADWYEDERERAGVSSPYLAVLAVAVPSVLLIRSIKYGARHLWTDTPTAIVPFLQGVIQKNVLQPGRDTILLNAKRDKEAEGWRRSTRRGACKYCRDLARDVTFTSEGQATFRAHTDCHCVAVPVFKNNKT